MKVVGPLGKAALEVTKANFMLWDFGNAPCSRIKYAFNFYLLLKSKIKLLCSAV